MTIFIIFKKITIISDFKSQHNSSLNIMKYTKHSPFSLMLYTHGSGFLNFFGRNKISIDLLSHYNFVNMVSIWFDNFYFTSKMDLYI